MKFNHYLISFFLIIGSFQLTNCGGGGGSGSGGIDVAGLEIAEQMSLVTPQESLEVPTLMKKIARMAVPTSGDFIDDVPDIYVYDKSMEVLDIVNEILCLVDQTEYFDHVNVGPYIAQIDNTACGRHDDKSGESGEQSSAQEQDLENWTVDVTRQDDSSPQIVRFWASFEADEDGFDEIRAELEITEGAGENNNFGVFTMNLVGLFDGEPVMEGNLTSEEGNDDLVELMMKMNMIGGPQSFQVHALITPNGAEGQAFGAFSDSFMNEEGDVENFEEEIQVAFDEDHYRASHGEDSKCLDRLNFDEHVWEYNLYEESGDRVTLNGGFSVRYGDEEDQIWGWCGYYGCWLPEDQVEVTDGLEVRSADDDTPYTVFQGAGRLIKRTRSTLQLGDFVGDQFHHSHAPTYGATEFVWVWDLLSRIFENSTNINIYDDFDQGTITIEAAETGTAGNSITIACTGSFTCSGSALTGGNSETHASATVSFEDRDNIAVGSTLQIGSVTYTRVEEGEWENMIVEWDGTNFIKTGTEECGDTGCEIVETEEEPLSFDAGEWVSLWKDGLGSLELVVPDDGVISNTMDVPYYGEEFVSPSDSLLASGDLTLQCYYNCLKPNLTADDVNAGSASYPDINEEGGTPYEYTFSAENYVLLFNGDPVTLEDGADLSGGPSEWGVRSGAMVGEEDLPSVPWEIWQADTIYEWETGPHPWNKYQELQDEDGETVAFDRPIDCLYQDTDHGTFFLNYEGEGQLHGIPYEEVSAEEGEWTYWVPVFSIPDGSELECDDNLYYTRAMAMEQIMQEDEASECDDLSSDDIGAPDNEFEDPNMPEAPDV